MKNLNPAYIAGVMDSDGSFTVMKRMKQSTVRGYHFRCVAQLTWKKTKLSFKTMKQLQSRYGGSLCEIKSRGGFSTKENSYYKWSLEGKNLENLVDDILPFLQLKKAHATAIKEFRILRNTWFHKGIDSLIKPDKIWKKEIKLYESLYSQNTKNCRRHLYVR